MVYRRSHITIFCWFKYQVCTGVYYNWNNYDLGIFENLALFAQGGENIMVNNFENTYFLAAIVSSLFILAVYFHVRKRR